VVSDLVGLICLPLLVLVVDRVLQLVNLKTIVRRLRHLRLKNLSLFLEDLVALEALIFERFC